MDRAIITRELLDDYGIEIGEHDEASLLAHLNETLEERVGAEITGELEDDQLVEYLKLQETASEEAVQNWLQQNVPELQQIVQDEIDILLGELAENSEAINQAVPA